VITCLSRIITKCSNLNPYPLASFDEHVAQTKSNLAFLSSVNPKINNYLDWQVTTCFYTSLHLVNAHLSTYGLQYRKHHDVNYGLNPDVQLSVSKLPQDEYDAYIALQRLSRRSRYLVNEKELHSTAAFFTYDKHIAKAIRHLDKLLNYFATVYKLDIKPVNFTCPDLKQSDNLKYFHLV